MINVPIKSKKRCKRDMLLERASSSSAYRILTKDAMEKVIVSVIAYEDDDIINSENKPIAPLFDGS